jgi:hypothetical protein
VGGGVCDDPFDRLEIIGVEAGPEHLPRARSGWLTLVWARIGVVTLVGLDGFGPRPDLWCRIDGSAPVDILDQRRPIAVIQRESVLVAADSGSREDDQDDWEVGGRPGVGTATVAAVTFADGGDNIGVYVPAFTIAGSSGMSAFGTLFSSGSVFLSVNSLSLPSYRRHRRC